MDEFKLVTKQYEESFRIHGDSPASLLCPKGRQQLRFRAIDPFVHKPGTRVLDYGCGLGHLLDHLEATGRSVEYTGMDMVPSFIDACRGKYPNRATFELVTPDTQVGGEFDVVFMSGVFNLAAGDPVESKCYALSKIEALFALAEEILICDFLSGFVDFSQPDAQHFSVGEIAQFAVERLSRRFVIRHDLRPYEFTLVVHKDARIARPENIFSVDAE